MGDEGERQLRALRPLRVTTMQEVFDHLAGQSDADSKALARQLVALATETDGWRLETTAARKIKLAVDQALYLDGFGVFLKGWALSPTHRITSMTLRLGDAILEGDAVFAALCSAARPCFGLPCGRISDRLRGFHLCLSRRFAGCRLR